MQSTSVGRGTFTESLQNEVNKRSEIRQTSQWNGNLSRHYTETSVNQSDMDDQSQMNETSTSTMYITGTEDLTSDTPTVAFYKKRPFWWDTFEKTDYSHSILSKYYNKELAPDVKQIPNMSRRSIHGSLDHSMPVSSLAERRAWSARYQSRTSSQGASAGSSSYSYRRYERLNHDSGDEYMDEVTERLVSDHKSWSIFRTLSTFIRTVLMTIVTSITSVYYSALSKFTGRSRSITPNARLYQSVRYADVQRSWFDRVFLQIYLHLCRRLLWDTQILTGLGHYIPRKNSNLLALVLLPPLLLLGYYVVQTYSFLYPKYLLKYQTTFSLPS